MLNELKKALDGHLVFLIEKYNVDLRGKVTLTTDLKGRAAGQAISYIDEERYEIRINPEIGLEFAISDTLPHEVAHILQAALGAKMDHGAAWHYYCIQLGGTGATTHNLDLTPSRKSRQWLYIVEGVEYVIGTIRHNRMQQKGVKYTTNNSVVISKEHFVCEV